ncbi:acyl-CoA thioesterase [Couchioplanes azureus]|uniref:acyl-CoA thioesterase n=1 Tax=Couchioplanes caeruleus TaxID=56438 RepID=UPI00167009CD|nr:thioesterase family protein [Couchioplanes caeruleus]GGQ65158.1 acyl-CoA thioesterase [Couchioplanes caeruleus subsp. azureus]
MTVTTGVPAVTRRVEHVDTDAAGVVHFSRYASLLETAILETLETLGAGVHRLLGEGLDLAVTDLRMTYLAPARFLDDLAIQVSVDQVGGASCRLAGEIARVAPGPATPLAHGTLRLCAVRRTDQKPAPLPGWMRTILRDAKDDPR